MKPDDAKPRPLNPDWLAEIATRLLVSMVRGGNVFDRREEELVGKAVLLAMALGHDLRMATGQGKGERDFPADVETRRSMWWSWTRPPGITRRGKWTPF